MKPIMDKISELIEEEMFKRFEKVPEDKAWGWLQVGDEGEPSTLAVQIELNEDKDAVTINLNLEKVIEENIESWLRDKEYEVIEQWRDLFAKFSAKMAAALHKRT